MSIHVLAPGLLTTVQDGGRRGRAAFGIGAAGAMDTVALRLANLLVGNAEDAAALEMTLHGPRLRFDEAAVIAIAGAEIGVRCSDRIMPAWRPVLVDAGNEIVFTGMARGTRAYLAVAGGIASTPVLGSRSSDLNGGVGGRVLKAGDTLPCAAADSARWRSLCASAARGARGFSAANWSLDPRAWFEPDLQLPIRTISGAHFPQLDEVSQHQLFESEFRIAKDSNRVGYRMDGPELKLRAPLELISEGVAPGTLQLPPGGHPIVLMAEAPTCGGYPRIAHVIDIDLPRLAQRRPGDPLRFAPISLEDAQTRYLAREEALAALRQTLAERLAA